MRLKSLFCWAFVISCSVTVCAGTLDERAEDALALMSLPEKLSLLQTVLTARLSPDKQPAGVAVGVGHTAGVERLGIPRLTETDASLGVANMGGFIRRNDGATALPSGLAMASTWNPDLIADGGRMIGSEARAKGFNVMLAGGVNLIREPRNGRNFEYFSEDPLLAGTLAGHAIKGIQSNHIVSTMKHFALNAQETGRAFLDVQMQEAVMRESDLLAFQIAHEIGEPGAVMCAYNKVNSQHACENEFLLNQVLRDDWGFQGWVMSDWGGVHSIPIQKGLDQESGVAELGGDSFYGAALRAALIKGDVSENDVDQAVLRILKTMFRIGLVDHPVAPGQFIDAEANASVAQRIAEQSIVLLKNDDETLPLSNKTGRLLVVGAHADAGVPQGGGSSQVWPTGGAALSLEIPGDVVYHRRLYMPSAPLDGLKSEMPNTEVLFDDGTDPKRSARLAKTVDAVVVFAEQFSAEGHDAVDLNLPNDQDRLIEAIADANPETVVVLQTGVPVMMPWLDRVAAVLQAWYSGQRGGMAIARVLSGAVNPSGRLPITYPKTLQQLPNPILPGSERIVYRPGSDLYDMPKEQAPLVVRYPEGSDVGYRWYAREKKQPLFPFGYGLSYTNFDMSIIRLSPDSAVVEVHNSGSKSGAMVAQLYLVERAGEPIHRLIGFQRVELAPGETRQLEVMLDPRLMADWQAHGWVQPEGTYSVALSSDATRPVDLHTIKLPERKWTDS